MFFDKHSYSVIRAVALSLLCLEISTHYSALPRNFNTCDFQGSRALFFASSHWFIWSLNNSTIYTVSWCCIYSPEADQVEFHHQEKGENNTRNRIRKTSDRITPIHTRFQRGIRKCSSSPWVKGPGHGAAKRKKDKIRHLAARRRRGEGEGRGGWVRFVSV